MVHEFRLNIVLEDTLQLGYILIDRVEPGFIDFWFEDGRHPVMNIANGPAGPGGDDGARSVGGFLSALVIPAFP